MLLLAACTNTPDPAPTTTTVPTLEPTATTAPALPTVPVIAPTTILEPEPIATLEPSPTVTLEPAPTITASPSGPTTTPVPTTSTIRLYLPWAGGGPAPATLTPVPEPTEQPTAAPAFTPLAVTPEPTRTATPPPQPVTKITKWGVGVYRGGGEYLQELLVARPTIILLVDPDPDFARDVRQWFPNAFIIGRIFVAEDQQKLDDPTARGVAFADRVAAVAVPLKGVVDAWMSYNEAVGHDNYPEYVAYNVFQVAFADRLQNYHGIAAIAGNDASGTVDPEDYPVYFADAIRASRYFGVHAYSPPASSSMKLDAEWNALRYRKVHAELEAAGIAGVQMVITESGLGDGWLGRASEAEMAADFAWFTDELSRDPYVIGHAAYGLFGDGTWRNFDLMHTSITRLMGDYQSPSAAN